MDTMIYKAVPAYGRAEKVGAEVAHNVRPCADGLETMPAPRGLVSLDCEEPVFIKGVSFGDTVFVYDAGFRLYAVAVDAGCAECIHPGVGSAVTGGYATADGVVLFTERSGALRFRHGEEGWTLADAPVTGRPTGIALRLVPSRLISRDLALTGLKGTYTQRSTRLTEADRAVVHKAVSAVFRDITDDAFAAGEVVNPLITRLLVTDCDGAAVYSGPPVLLMAAGMPQHGAVEITLGGSGFNVAGEVTVSMQSYKVVAERVAPASGEAGLTVIVQRMPPLQPYSEEATCACRLGAVGGSATEMLLRVWLPGWQTDGSCPLPAAQALRLLSLTGEADAFTDVASFAAEAVTMAAPVAVNPCLDSFATHMTQLRKLLTRSAAADAGDADDARWLRRLSPEGMCRFSPRAIAVNGDSVALGALTVSRFSGYAPFAMRCAGTAVADVESPPTVPFAASVRMADGSVEVTSGMLYDGAVGSLSPLLLYPADDAREMTLVIGTRCVTVPLTPLPSGGWSYYLAPSLAPVELMGELPYFVLPAASPATLYGGNIVAVSTSAHPLEVRCVSRVGTAGEIYGLAPMCRSQNRLSSANNGFLVGGSSGIYILRVNATRTAASVSMADRRPLSGKKAWCQADNSLLAGVEGALLEVAGSSVREVVSGLTPLEIAYDPRRREAWCLAASQTLFPRDLGDTVPCHAPFDPPVVVCRLADSALYTTGASRPVTMMYFAGRMLLGYADGTVNDHLADPEGETDFILRLCRRAERSAPGYRRHFLPIAGRGSALTVAVGSPTALFGRFYCEDADISDGLTVCLHNPETHAFALTCHGSGRFVFNHLSIPCHHEAHI